MVPRHRNSRYPNTGPTRTSGTAESKFRHEEFDFDDEFHKTTGDEQTAAHTAT